MDASPGKRILAVDPSLTCTGWAVFDGGFLSDCGIVATSRRDSPISRMKSAGCYLRDKLVFDALIIEWPQVYTRAKSKGDPNDLLWVAGVAACVLAMVPAASVVLLRPAEWKGQTPKDVHNARVIKRLMPHELSVLSRAELPKSLANNAIDAIGLGLFLTGRMGSYAINSAANDDQEIAAPRSRAPARRANRRG